LVFDRRAAKGRDGGRSQVATPVHGARAFVVTQASTDGAWAFVVREAG